MGYALLIPRGKKSLELKLYSSDFEKLHLVGTVSLRAGKFWKLNSKRFSNPVARKELLKLLRQQKVAFSSEHRERLEPLVKAERLNYGVAELCSPCLSWGRVKSVRSSYYLYNGNKLCLRCTEEELKRELKFRGFSPSSFEHFAKLLRREKSLDKIFKILRYQSWEERYTLYDRVEAGYSGGVGLEGLPLRKEFKKLLEERGIGKLTPVQKLAVDNGLMEGSSLLVSSSTASGKTLIAELAGIEGALRGKKFLFLVPLVALANQKYEDFKVYSKLGLKVALRVGRNRLRDREEPSMRDTGLEGADIVVGTYEGVDHILRSGNWKSLEGVGVIAIDEVQNLSEEERGVELDGLLTRLTNAFPEAQLIALTATLGNIDEIAAHYSLSPLTSEARPIPLERHLIFARGEEEKRLAILRFVRKEKNERSSKGFYGQSLIFTNTRRKTRSLAEFLSARGVRTSEYHSGLSYRRRKIIERSFLGHRLDCVVTTAALGAGVDFPASQVVLESPSMGNRWLKTRDFLQIAGRAGRPSYHDRGKVMLLASPKSGFFSSRSGEDEVAVGLLSGEPEPVGVASSREEGEEQFLACVASSSSLRKGRAMAENMLLPSSPGRAQKRLKELGMVGKSRITPLGKLAARHFLKPDEAKVMYESGEGAEKLLSKLFPFSNAYISRRMASTIKRSYRMAVPLRYFNAIGILFDEPREELMDVVELVKQELMSCSCKEFPYCDHALRELSRKIIRLRREGLSIREINQRLSAYHLETFSGDIYSYLDSLIRRAEGLREILSLKKSPRTREVERLIKEVQG